MAGIASSIPFTTTVTSHGLLIKLAGGDAIGAITSWSAKHARSATPVFEFGSLTTGPGGDVEADAGEPYELVPGNIDGTTISINRYDIYTKRFEHAFGTNDLVMLTRQDKPIQLIEFFATPEGGLAFTHVYHGCWFTSLGRTLDAKGDRLVLVNAEVRYTRRRAA